MRLDDSKAAPKLNANGVQAKAATPTDAAPRMAQDSRVPARPVAAPELPVAKAQSADGLKNVGRIALKSTLAAAGVFAAGWLAGGLAPAAFFSGPLTFVSLALVPVLGVLGWKAPELAQKLFKRFF